MATKAQHAADYQRLPPFLRALRDEAKLTQRQLGERLGKPQSWVYNCETGNRRVDVTEFVAWAQACGLDPQNAFARFLRPGEEAGPDESRRADQPPPRPPRRLGRVRPGGPLSRPRRQDQPGRARGAHQPGRPKPVSPAE